MSAVFVEFEELQKASEYQRPADVERWLRDNRVRYMTSRNGKPRTTREAINQALGIMPANESPAPYSPELFAKEPPAFEWLAENIGRFLIPLCELEARALEYPGAEIPRSPGVYFLFNGSALAYIGLSVDLGARVDSHFMALREFDRVAFVDGIRRDCLTEIEAFYIRALDPPQNEKIPPTFSEAASNALAAYRKGELFK